MAFCQSSLNLNLNRFWRHWISIRLQFWLHSSRFRYSTKFSTLTTTLWINWVHGNNNNDPNLLTYEHCSASRHNVFWRFQQIWGYFLFPKRLYVFLSHKWLTSLFANKRFNRRLQKYDGRFGERSPSFSIELCEKNLKPHQCFNRFKALTF